MVRESYLISISSDEAAKKTPFIYSGYVPSLRVLYIGETRASMGALGRIAQHVSYCSSNTFRQRICQILRYEEVSLKDMVFLAVPLSQYRSFWLDTSEYRVAVEYLVQNKILSHIATSQMKITLISRVSANGYCQTAFVKEEAKVVANRISVWLDKCGQPSLGK